MIVDRLFHELSVGELHGILRLRAEVFVVEQNCVYLDVDGRDSEPGTRHMWVPVAALHAGGSPTTESQAIGAYLRVLDNGDHRTIGRVVTAAEFRGEGLAEQLVQHVLASTVGAWTLDAQTYLEGWYQRFGFARTGDDFDEDGIMHLPMRREN